MPAADAESLMDCVLAVRQPLSAPTWAKPRTSCLFAAGVLVPVSLLPHAARLVARTPIATVAKTFLNTVYSLPSRGGGAFPATARVRGILVRAVAVLLAVQLLSIAKVIDVNAPNHE